MIGVAPIEPKNIRSRKYRYEQVVGYVRDGIINGKYLPGDKLPSLSALSSALGVNHRTISKGLNNLVKEGYVHILPNVGTFVSYQSSSAKSKMSQIIIAFRSFRLEINKNHPIMGAYWSGIHNSLSPLEFMTNSFCFKEAKLTEQFGDVILAQKPKGIIAFDSGLSQKDYQFFEQNKIPLVECYPATFEISSDYAVQISWNDIGVLRQAVEHLRCYGHKRVCFLPYGMRGAIHREFEQMIYDFQMGSSSDLLVPIDCPEGRLDFSKLERVFSLKPAPTAVVVYDGFMADAFLSACHQRGIRVPDDISLVALFDETPYAHRVPLTAANSVSVASEVSSMACEVLKEMISGKEVKKSQKILPKLVLKASSAPVPD